MKKQLAVCAGLLLLGIATGGMAQAQPVYPGAAVSDPVLPPYEIMSIVRSTGLAPLTRPMRRGPYYVLVAVDRVGRQMRVVVDAQLGDIVNLRPALGVASYGPELTRPSGLPVAPAPPLEATVAPPPYAAHPSSDNALPPTPPRPFTAHAMTDVGPAPTPPRDIPNPGTPNAGPALPPTRLAVTEPGPPSPSPPRLPLPRPRPNVALNEAPAPAPAAAPAVAPAVKPPTPAAAPAPATAAKDADQQIE
ncbi:MAG TPA: hypothetical protein VIY51_14460 [Xanthobacteraceae bacterium]